MSSKTVRRADPGRPGSIIARMTAWYAGSAFLLILIATGYLYWTVAANMRAEDRRILTNTAANLHDLVHETGADNTRHLLARETGKLTRTRLIWIRVIGVDGQIRLETRGMDAALPVADFPALLAIPAGDQVIRTVQTRAGKLFQTLSTRFAGTGRTDRIFQVAIDRTDEQRLLVRYRERLLLVLIASLGFCAAIGYAIARFFLRPMERIIATTRTIGSTTLHERLDPAGLPTELQALAETFNDMLDRLEASFAQVSRFSADVAHELRTPVNNLRGEIEVALGRARDPEQYRDVLGSALEECGRIDRVIASLLFLARAESDGARPQCETLDLQAEIAAILEFYEAAAVEAGIGLTAEVAGRPMAVFDRTLLQQAIGNLIANAIAHTPRGGTVAVRARQDDHGGVTIAVADTGQGIAAEHLPHVFERFFRADPARSGKGGNVGLGLSVVRSIAALHGGTVTIESRPGEGTRVALTTPGSV